VLFVFDYSCNEDDDVGIGYEDDLLFLVLVFYSENYHSQIVVAND